MDSRLEKIVSVLQQQAGASVEEFRGEVRVNVPPDKIVDTLLFLRDEHEFSLLSVLTAIDYWPQDRPRYLVIYGLTSLTQNLLIQVRVGLPADAAKLPRCPGIRPIPGPLPGGNYWNEPTFKYRKVEELSHETG